MSSESIIEGTGRPTSKSFQYSPKLQKGKGRDCRMYKTCTCSCRMQKSYIMRLKAQDIVYRNSGSTKQMVVKVVNAETC
jgi:hypothetical protein